MTSRKLIPSDYEQLSEWWVEWGWEFPPNKDFLPEDGCGGIMISDGGVNICAGFLYKVSNAQIGWFTFPISNPHIRGDLRKNAIELLINEIEKECNVCGIKYIYSCLRNIPMIEAQKRNGYAESGKQFTELLKVL